MCLRDQQKTKILTDMAGYKIMIPTESGNGYNSLFAAVFLVPGVWHEARALWYGSHDFSLRELREYGFHAYVTKEDAEHVAAAARAWAYPAVVVVEVELADVFLTGDDSSFPDLRPPCVVARAMRILR